jgi:hypothetical protein
MVGWITVGLGVVGPLLGVALGWYLKSSSDATQWYRGEVRSVFADLLIKLDTAQHTIGGAGLAARAQNAIEFKSAAQAALDAIYGVDRAVSTTLLLVSETDEPELRKVVNASIMEMAKMLEEATMSLAASLAMPPDFQPRLEAVDTTHSLSIYEAHQLALAMGRRAMKARRPP